MELPKHFEYFGKGAVSLCTTNSEGDRRSPEEFERKTSNIIEKLIREQGDEICQEKIGIDYIKDRLKDYDFGFIRSSVKAQMGQRKTRQTSTVAEPPSKLVVKRLHVPCAPCQTEQHAYSFVLCKLLPNPLFTNIDITLVCSRTNSKDGKLLLELVEKHANNLKYDCLSLIAVGDTRLLNWYKSQGFVLETDKPIINSNCKAYYMRKIM
uniref:N-acetyltransferase domain-containing protein n=1 Tax=viral metagenome TaxID=1070528 RepID=A0A6C0ID83_9ZZZZ